MYIYVNFDYLLLQPSISISLAFETLFSYRKELIRGDKNMKMKTRLTLVSLFVLITAATAAKTKVSVLVPIIGSS
jgi:hypothetical protein